jgi:hypothetical protein
VFDLKIRPQGRIFYPEGMVSARLETDLCICAKMDRFHGDMMQVFDPEIGMPIPERSPWRESPWRK